MVAFSIFFESCEKTKAGSQDGGVKVFTFWIEAYEVFSWVSSSRTQLPLSSCQISTWGLVRRALTHSSGLRAKSSAVLMPNLRRYADVCIPMPHTFSMSGVKRRTMAKRRFESNEYVS